MAPKRKSGSFTSEWIKCVHCEIILMSRDVNSHDANSCRTIKEEFEECHAIAGVLPNLKFINHGFIKENLICGCVVQLKTSDTLKNIPTHLHKHLVILHPIVMKLCGIAIGDKVLVISSSRYLVLTAWPSCSFKNSTSGLHLTNVIVPQLLTRQLKPANYVYVRRFSEPHVKATEVTVVANCRHKYHNSCPEFKSYLLHDNDGLFIGCNSILYCRYFGQACSFTVSQINGEDGTTVHGDNRLTREETITELIDDSVSQLNDSSIDNLDINSLSINEASFSDSSFARSASTPIKSDFNKLTNFTSVDPSTFVASSVARKHGDSSRFYYLSEGTSMRITDASKDAGCDKLEASKTGVEFKDIGALKGQLEKIMEVFTMRQEKLFQLESLGFKPTCGILLYGPPGTGKTMIGRAIANELETKFVAINGPEVYSKFYGETEATLRKIFTDARNSSPTVIFIDEIDALCPKREGSQTDQEKRVVSTILSLLDDLSTDKGADVVVVAATNKPDSLDAALRRPGRLDKEIEIGIPDAEGRFEILEKTMAKVQHRLTDEDLRSVADISHGFTGADLSSVCTEAGVHALKMKLSQSSERPPPTDEEMCDKIYISVADMLYALKTIKPSAMREIRLEVPKVYWTDIGGMDELKLKLKQAIEWPIKHPEAFRRMGIKSPKGILMFGPPGCSKTMIAKALATESGLNFISIKGPELFSKWVGESERAVREVFRKARAASPAIIFFDEIDAIAGERGSGSSSSGVGDRVLTQLLTEMDGIEYLENVVIVAATNRPDMIDKALMRPGRLDRIVYVPLPDVETRRKILEIQFRKTPVDDDVSAVELAETTDNYSGAELVALCQEATILAMQQDMNVERVRRKHFEDALDIVLPRIQPRLVKFYADYQSKCRLHRI